jgi:hypothetical protein
MLKGLIESFKARKMARDLNSHPIYGIALAMLRSTFDNKSEGLGKHASETTKQTILAQILGEVQKVLSAPNPVMANRERLTGCAISFAKWQVLVLPPVSEEPADPTGLRGKPGITGELKAHVGELAKIDKDLKELSFELGDDVTEVDLRDAVLMRYWRAVNDLNIWNAIRIKLGDCHADHAKDWFHPFLASMCAREEHDYRQHLGLPDALAAQDGFGDIAALKHATFMNFVMDGSRYPNHDWEEHYKRRD